MFLHRLALALGKTLQEISGMSSRELDSWQRFWSVEPWGPYRDNMHAGILAASMLAPHVKKGKKPPTWRDFMLKDPATAQRERKANTAHVLAQLKAMAVRPDQVKARTKRGKQ